MNNSQNAAACKIGMTSSMVIIILARFLRQYSMHQPAGGRDVVAQTGQSAGKDESTKKQSSRTACPFQSRERRLLYHFQHRSRDNQRKKVQTLVVGLPVSVLAYQLCHACVFSNNFRRDFKFHRVGVASADSGVNKSVLTRGFTPPFKKPHLALASSCTPQSGLTSTTSLTTCNVRSGSLSDQTTRTKPFTQGVPSSRLSLPQGTKVPQERSLHTGSVLPRREETPSKPHSLTNSLDDGQYSTTNGRGMQKSSPPVAFVAPVISKPTMSRSVTQPGDCYYTPCTCARGKVISVVVIVVSTKIAATCKFRNLST